MNMRQGLVFGVAVLGMTLEGVWAAAGEDGRETLLAQVVLMHHDDALEHLAAIVDGRRDVELLPFVKDVLAQVEGDKCERAMEIWRKWDVALVVLDDPRLRLNEWDATVDAWLAAGDVDVEEQAHVLMNSPLRDRNAAGSRAKIKLADRALVEGDAATAARHAADVFRSSAPHLDRLDAFRIWAEADPEAAAEFAMYILDRKQDPWFRTELAYLFNDAEGPRARAVRERVQAEVVRRGLPGGEC